MIDRTTRLRWRRHFRRRRRQAEDISVQAEETLERHFIKRLGRLIDVKRFVVGWLLLFILLAGMVVMQTRALSSYYQELRPAKGGIYTEGIIGAFTNANPIYATGLVDSTVSRLVFSGLLKYDENNQLVGDLAESWNVDASGLIYTVKLKNNLFWHDGHSLKSEDVLFTYQLIQNPDAKSVLFTSWQGIKLAAPDELTIVFTLPNLYSSFQYSLTNGIIPKHVLANIPVEQLRSSRFNTNEPVGSGPFKWDNIEVEGNTPEKRKVRIGLVKNTSYHEGEPAIAQYVVHTFKTEEKLLESLINRELNAALGLESLPDTLSEESEIQPISIPVTGAVMAFFKTSQEYLKDVKVRQAMVKAVNTKELVDGLEYTATTVNGPLLKSHLGYDKSLTQFGYNFDEANKLLDEAGWLRTEENEIRSKDGKKLELIFYAQNSGEYTYVTQYLQTAWRKIGVSVEVIQPDDNEFQQTVAQNRNYDIVLYGISLGVDPDVFAYWHSSQADVRSANRLNLSEYSSPAADQPLESGRTRSDPAVRTVKYKAFLETWRNDAPALALYQPRLLYVVRGGLYGFNPSEVNSSADRLSNVHKWMIRQEKTVKD